MTARIILDHSNISIELLEKRKAIDTEMAKYYHDLSDVLIRTLDKLLKRNRLDLKALKSYEIQGNLGTDSTSYKIASAFIRGLQI